MKILCLVYSNWLHVNPSGVISCQEVSESLTLISIFTFWWSFLKFFFCRHLNDIKSSNLLEILCTQSSRLGLWNTRTASLQIDKTLLMSALDNETKLHLMVRHQFRSFEECGEPVHYHYFQDRSNLKWQYLLGSRLWIK